MVYVSCVAALCVAALNGVAIGADGGESPGRTTGFHGHHVEAAVRIDPGAADTTFAIERGQSLSLQNLSGRVTVETWDRNEVRIEVGGEGHEGVRVHGDGSRIQVRPGERHEHGRDRYLVSVPAWAELEIRGSELDVSVRGVNGGIEIRTGEGDVEVMDVQGPVAARSVEGRVRVVNVVGFVEVFSGDADVTLRQVRGPVMAKTVDGDIHLEDVDAPELEATAVDGDVWFSGPLRRDGEYRLGTHDGDLVMAMDPDVDASVVVSTFAGEFESDFLVTMDRFQAGKALRFTLGRGGAQVQLEVFDGDIQLRRR